MAAAGQGLGHRGRRHGARREGRAAPCVAAVRGRQRRGREGARLPRGARPAIRRSAIRCAPRSWSAERRWNLRLKNGIDVRLPETDVEGALETLARLDREKNLLIRDIVGGRSAASPTASRCASPMRPRRRARKRSRRPPRRKAATRERSGARPCPQDEADLAQALGDRVRARHRHQQDRLRDRAAEAAPAAGRAAAPHPFGRGARHRARAGAGHEVRQRGRHRGGGRNAAPRGRQAERAAGVHVDSRRAADHRRPHRERTVRRDRAHEDADRERRRHRARARGRQPSFGARRPRRAAFAADRLRARRQPRHPRSARHDRRSGSASTCMWRPPMSRPRAISRCWSSAAISASRRWSRRPTCPGFRCWPRTRPISARPWSISAPAPRRSRCSPKAASSMSTASRSAASTSRWISRAGSPPRSRTPSG